jgi:hypothetical protein
MKKIITLCFFTALFASAFAQSKSRDWDDRNTNSNPNWNSNTGKVYQNDRNGDGRPDRQYNNQSNTVAQRDMEIQRISRQYDYQIQQVNYDRSLSRRVKKNTIKSLEAQKIQQINRINTQYNNSVYNNGNNRNHDYKQNNRYNNRRDNDQDNDNRYNR